MISLNIRDKEEQTVKSDDEVIRQIEENPNFFEETFADLRRENPYLAAFMSRVVMSNEENKEISGRILQMLLIAMKSMGMTDKDDPDFVRISMDIAIKAEREEMPYDVYEGFTRKSMELICSIVGNFDVTFGQVMEYFEVVAQAILLEQNKRENLSGETNEEDVLAKGIMDLSPKQKELVKKYLPLPPYLRKEL